MKQKNIAYKTLQLIAIIVLVLALIVTGAYFLVQNSLSVAEENGGLPELFGYKFVPVLDDKTADVGIAEIGDMVLFQSVATEEQLTQSDTVAFKASDSVRTNLYGENYTDYCIGIVSTAEIIDGEEMYYISVDLNETPVAVSTSTEFFKGEYAVGVLGSLFKSMTSSLGIVYFVTIPIALFVIMQLVAVLVKVLSNANSDELIEEIKEVKPIEKAPISKATTEGAVKSNPLFVSKIDEKPPTISQKDIAPKVVTPKVDTVPAIKSVDEVQKEKTTEIKPVVLPKVEQPIAATPISKAEPITTTPSQVNLPNMQEDRLEEEKKKIIDEFLISTPIVSLDDEIMLIDKLLKEIPSSPIVEELMKSETISTLNTDFLPEAAPDMEAKSDKAFEDFMSVQKSSSSLAVITQLDKAISTNDYENLDNTIEFDLELAKQGLPVDEITKQAERDNFIKIAETFALNNFVSIDLKEDAIDFDFKNIKANAIEVKANEQGDGFIISTPNYEADIKVDVKRK